MGGRGSSLNWPMKRKDLVKYATYSTIKGGHSVTKSRFFCVTMQNHHSYIIPFCGQFVA